MCRKQDGWSSLQGWEQVWRRNAGSNNGLRRERKNAHPRQRFVRLPCRRTVVLPVYDLAPPSPAGWHPREDFIFMFANLLLYLPEEAINTLLCLPEKCLKKQFVQVLSGLVWQYSWLMTAAKFGRRPRERRNLICLGVLHFNIIPARLCLCVFWTRQLHSLLFPQFTNEADEQPWSTQRAVL